MTTLHDLPAIIRRAIRTGTNLHIVGVPGIGKTSIVEQTVAGIQKDNPKFGLWVFYTPAMSPVDFVVAMPDPATGTLKMYRNEMLPNAYDDPDQEGVVFFGERDSGDPATNKVAQKYTNGEDLGHLIKPKKVICISDSNDISHRSGVVQQSLALKSRFREVWVDSTADATLKYFSEIGVNPYVQAYLSLRKEHVNTFEELLKTRGYAVFANQRAWERLAKALDDAAAHGEKVSDAEIIGDVGEGVGKEFIAFLHAAKVLVSYDEIVKDPMKAQWPAKMDDVYAITAMLAQSVQGPHMGAVRTFVERHNHIELEVLFLRMLMHAKGNKHREACTRTKEYTTWTAKKEIQQAMGTY